MTNTKRRVFLKGTLASGAIAVAAGAGMLSPRQVLAAWPANAFEARSYQAAMNALFGKDATEASNRIEVRAPDIAENGAVVPITVETDLPNIKSISIIAEENGSPLAAKFDMGGNARGNVSTRIKMGQSSDVIAVVESNGKLYSARKEVKVTIGGCGG